MHAAATVDELETKALALPEPDRVRLVGALVRSLTADDEIAAAWFDEAEARDREMGEDPDAGVPAGEVFRRATARLG
jgi:putative addiction module component (TIGR02574 family)